MMTAKELKNFEAKVEEKFLKKEILAPIHLSDGNEDYLIDIFKTVGEDDWVFSTWRSHYHALLHGIPEDEVMRQIVEGNSMSINYKNPNFFSSAIVGSTLPIALGVALNIKREGGMNRVWCFIGDMAAQTGIFEETRKYAENFNLPMTIIVENNGVSVGADTKKVWGEGGANYEYFDLWNYDYKKEKYPHVGAGKWVTF